MKKLSKQTRKNLLNSLIILGTVAAVIYLAAKNGDINVSVQAMLSSDKRWLGIGFAAWGLSMVTEALINQCFFIWQRVNIRFFSTLHVTLLGMFYSNVTPAATGGQPMQVFAFKKRGVPVGVSSSSLAVKFFCFQAALLTGGAAWWLCQQKFVNACVIGGKWLIFAGFAINGLSVALVLLLAINRNLVRFVIVLIIRLGQKLRLVRDPERLSSRADAALDDFGASVNMLVHHPLQITLLVILSLAQLFLLMSASYCVYRALGLCGERWYRLMTLQWLLFIAASFTPLPGASGVQEGGFYVFFGSIFPEQLIFPALLLWRTITYYGALLIGLGAVIYESARSMRGNRKMAAARVKEKPAQEAGPAAPNKEPAEESGAPAREDPFPAQPEVSGSEVSE